MKALELGYPRTDLRRELVALVLAGAKTTTAGLGEEEEDGERAPGERLALLGWDGEPVGTVEVVEHRIVPAAEIDERFARDEGEGFETVDDWRVAHEEFFGGPIEPDTPISALRFRLVQA